jgi:hypothetical protein
VFLRGIALASDVQKVGSLNFLRRDNMTVQAIKTMFSLETTKTTRAGVLGCCRKQVTVEPTKLGKAVNAVKNAFSAMTTFAANHKKALIGTTVVAGAATAGVYYMGGTAATVDTVKGLANQAFSFFSTTNTTV